MSATYPTGESAIRALVEAKTLLEGITGLQRRVTDLGIRLGNAAQEADWRGRAALSAVDEFARTDPLQLQRTHPSEDSLNWLELGDERVRSLEHQVEELLAGLVDGEAP
jgi:hypothetical protein